MLIKELLQLVIFTALLFWISKISLRRLYFLLAGILKRERVVNIVLSIVYLPGTILHEFAHFLTALVLMLRVQDIRIFPKFEEEEIKLGEVSFEKKDFIRGILVGVSPILFGFLFFWIIASFKIFPQKSLLMNIIFGYLIFTVSSTMFSSKKDLTDLIYVVPLAIIIWGIFFVFNIHLGSFLMKLDPTSLISSIKLLNLYLLYSLLINLLFIFLSFLIKILVNK